MTLYDKSLKLALLASVALLTACPPDNKDDTGTPADVDTDTDADTDTDTDTDTDADVDTGVAQLYWLVDFATPAGEFESAQLGFGVFGFVDQDWACQVQGEMTYEGEAAAGCPSCDWSFDLSAVSGSVAEGPYCDQFFADGYVDTYFDWNWGFSDEYVYYDSKGNPYAIEQALFINSGTDWGMFAFNYGANFQMITGDAESLHAESAASDGTSYLYYYYYR
ncbi:MAG: hypothetical protein Q8P41_01490 [Pseudomonadota bacterium]|nr:hypothetical protein [Pseudomonadota bacterium]